MKNAGLVLITLICAVPSVLAVVYMTTGVDYIGVFIDWMQTTFQGIL